MGEVSELLTALHRLLGDVAEVFLEFLVGLLGYLEATSHSFEVDPKSVVFIFQILLPLIL